MHRSSIDCTRRWILNETGQWIHSLAQGENSSNFYSKDNGYESDTRNSNTDFDYDNNINQFNTIESDDKIDSVNNDSNNNSKSNSYAVRGNSKIFKNHILKIYRNL